MKSPVRVHSGLFSWRTLYISHSLVFLRSVQPEVSIIIALITSEFLLLTV